MEGTLLEPGTLIEHRYRIRRFISAGGVAHVYMATHEVTGRDVALKLPRQDRPQDAVVHARIRREAQALAAARHPGVAEILDFGEFMGAPYLVLELLEGRTLGGLLAARGRMPWQHAASVGEKAARVLAHCHQRGVVHRDIKPDNLFVVPSGAQTVKIFDFGIASMPVSAIEGAVSQKLTVEGAILGTPEYMAPEALQMLPTSDHRVDIYALGITLFELMTGAVPFEGRYADVLVQVSTKELPKLASVLPGVPAALAQAVDRSLEKDPAARYQSAADFSRDLGVALHDVGPVELIAAARPDPQPLTMPKMTAPEGPAALRVAQAPPAKRRYPRAPYTTPAEFTFASGATLSGRVEEISEGGLQFIAAQGVASGERGQFRFSEPITGRVVKLYATSRWTKAGRAAHATGFEFESAPDELRAIVRKYVELMGGS
jgi:serine/threonine-protein kinase